jgi:hypothetical protein
LLCEAIGEIGGSLIEDESKGNRWPELISELWSMFQHTELKIIESAFKIL